MRKVTSILALLGLFTLAISWIQWFFRFPDTSQLCLGSAISICFFSFGYIYNLIKNLEDRQIELDDKIEGVIKIYAKKEFE